MPSVKTTPTPGTTGTLLIDDPRPQPVLAAGLRTPTALRAARGVLADRDALPALVTTPRPLVAELGVEAGAYADVYTRALPDGTFWFVDLWQTTSSYFTYGTQPGRVERGYQRCVERYGNDPRVTMIRSLTWEAAARFPDNFFDFVYIDADHSYEACLADLRAWYPKVRRGGLIAGHDFDPAPEQECFEQFGVDRAVRELLGEDFALTGERAWRSWWHIRP
jgi:hypothetical protein